MLQFRYAVILSVLMSGIFSCDEDESRDTIAPEITVETLKENQRVAGMIVITASAEDKDQEITLQALLDGTLLAESSTNQISVQYDTKTLTEGLHEIKITAVDKSANASEKVFNIEVRNTLFKAQISSNYVPEEFTHIYFGLSTNDGTELSFNEVVNGATITVPTPVGFNPDSTFVLTEYFYLNQPPSNPGGTTTIVRNTMVKAGLYAGEFSTTKYLSYPPSTGSHHFEVTDVPTAYYSAGLRGKNTSSKVGFFGADGVIAGDLGMTSTTSDLFFDFRLTETSVPVYKYVSSISVGGSTIFSLNGLSQMQKAEVTTKDAAGSYYSFVNVNESNTLTNLYSEDGNFENGKLPFYYPSATYPQYVFDLRYQNGANRYQYQSRGATPPAAFQYVTASATNVNYVNRRLKVSATGAFDIVHIQGNGFSIVGTSYIYDLYSVSFPAAAKNTVVIPNTPVGLTTAGFKSPTVFTFTEAGFSEFPGLSGQSDYQSKIIFDADQVQYRDYFGMVTQITTTSTGGRVSTHEKIELPKHLESVLRIRMPQRY
jgi:hypothetical protein